MGSSAWAADFTPVVLADPAPMAPATFGWEGTYVGAYGGFTFGVFGSNAGAILGHNFVNGRFVGGVDARLAAGVASGIYFATINGRAGFLIGDQALVYAVAGVGTVPFVATYIYTAGAGMEFAVGNSISLCVEAKAVGTFGGGCCFATVQMGLNWHP